MRNLFIMFVVISAVFVGSCNKDDKKFFLPGDGTTSENGTSAPVSGGATTDGGSNTPADVINDQTDTKEFKYQTLHEVTFNLQVFDEANNPLSQAVIHVISEQGDISTAMTAENGTVSFKISIANSIETVSLIIEHSNCITKTLDLENIQSLATVDRTIFLELKQEGKQKSDRDQDGVPDDADEFPDDPYLIGTVYGEYTIAFEDLYPQKGDADFNDLVVRLGIREFIDNNNMISKIVITSKVLAAGAGYKNQFWISVLGKDYQLITDPKKDLGGKLNALNTETYVDGPVHTQEIVPVAPVLRDTIDAMPYDPYIRCNGVSTKQVHLPFVKTNFTGNVLDVDGFPWAILVPGDWAWPYEATPIFSAYPEFKPWYESKGEEYKDWYIHPEVDYVFKASATTALAAYLMKVSANVNTGIMLGILTSMLLIVVGINFWRKRQMGA
jgi:hypothetical protein